MPILLYGKRGMDGLVKVMRGLTQIKTRDFGVCGKKKKSTHSLKS